MVKGRAQTCCRWRLDTRVAALHASVVEQAPARRPRPACRPMQSGRRRPARRRRGRFGKEARRGRGRSPVAARRCPGAPSRDCPARRAPRCPCLARGQPEWYKAVKSAALEAASSSIRGSSWIPSSRASPWECQVAQARPEEAQEPL
eukprot:scaffold80716_cov66-Phaeocystis_antarctica.AAC.3